LERASRAFCRGSVFSSAFSDCSTAHISEFHEPSISSEPDEVTFAGFTNAMSELSLDDSVHPNGELQGTHRLSKTDCALIESPLPILASQINDRVKTAEPAIEISPWRFALSIMVGNAVLVGFMVIFLVGITLKSNVMDPIGSSAAADKQVELFQTLNGYFAAIVGMILEWGFEIFIAVMLTCLGHLGCGYAIVDQEGSIGGRFKAVLLFGFGPAVFFILNVGISAMNIQHSITGVSRAFISDDLVATTLSVKSTNATTINIKNTILRPVVLNRAEPFELLADSSCIVKTVSQGSVASSASASAAAGASAAGEYVELPTVKETRSTAVVFGFPAQSWNYRALPNALTATHSVNLSLADASSKDVDSVGAFFEATGSDYQTMFELFLQGKLMLERTVSDADVSAEYPCSWVDGKYSDDLNGVSVSSSTNTTFAFFDGGDYDGMRICNGAVSSLQDLANMIDGSTTYHTLDALANSIMDGLNKTVSKIAPDEIEMKLESFQLSRQMKVLSMTLDVPLMASARYRDVSEYCDSNGTLLADYVDPTWTADDLADYTAIYCSQDNYPYDTPRATCGATNCIFLDKSGLLPLKKQILMMPYLTNCSVTNMTYDSDYLNFLPHDCKKPPSGDAVFLYGLGTYISGDTLDSGAADDTTPFIYLPRRHVVLSFAKLHWTVENVSTVFNAECQLTNTSSCSGLIHVLKNLTVSSSQTVQVLVVGNDSIPSERLTADFRHPVPLVTLNSPPFYYKSAKAYYEWEYLDEKRFTTVSWNKSQSLNRVGCSVLVDSYIEQLETNHYYLDEPLQPMYASALFYLFQDAAIKTVSLASTSSSANLTTNSYLGSARFDGDRERKEIKYSIPFASAIATYIGIGLLLLLAVLVVAMPQERVKISDTHNLAARYVEILTEEDYPEKVHLHRLELHNGDKVEMEEYHVENIDLVWKKSGRTGAEGSVNALVRI
jgi:hypothetical protein